MSTPFSAVVYKDGSYTCICIDRTDKVVKFIPMASLQVETATPKAFDTQWTAYPEYPARRAAERYLASVQYRTIHAKVHEHLSTIVADPATAYPTFESLNPVKPKGKSEMASKKPANGLNTVVDNAKAVAHNRRAGDKPAAAAKPAKTKPEAKAAVKAPAKTKPEVVAKAPAKAKPEATAKPAAAAKPAAVPKAPKAPDTTKYKIGDTASVKRGFLAEFVEKAQGLKTFTRDTLEAEFGGRQGSKEAQTMGTYFPYAVGKGIFVTAK